MRDVESHGHSDTDRREVAGATGDCGGEHDDDEKKASTASITNLAAGVIVSVVAPRATFCGELGPAEAGGDATKHCP